MARYKLTLKAKADLIDIASYTQARWGVLQRNQYLTDLDARMRWLAENPQLGQKRDHIKPGYLSYKQGSHVIFYRCTGQTIEILSVLHERMDFEQRL